MLIRQTHHWLIGTCSSVQRGTFEYSKTRAAVSINYHYLISSEYSRHRDAKLSY
jgi:hypothetical protein